jgi:hypothetical protein
LKKISKKDKKDREKRKEKYIKELEKIGFSDITKFRFKWQKQTVSQEDWLKPIIKIEIGADPEICSTAAIKELSHTKYGPKIVIHDKVNSLNTLLEREDNLDKLMPDGKEDKLQKLIEAIQNNVNSNDV